MRRDFVSLFTVVTNIEENQPPPPGMEADDLKRKVKTISEHNSSMAARLLSDTLERCTTLQWMVLDNNLDNIPIDAGHDNNEGSNLLAYVMNYGKSSFSGEQGKERFSRIGFDLSPLIECLDYCNIPHTLDVGEIHIGMPRIAGRLSELTGRSVPEKTAYAWLMKAKKEDNKDYYTPAAGKGHPASASERNLRIIADRHKKS